MRGCIDKNGLLHIDRKVTDMFPVMTCPFTSNESPCGSWCPLFGEPEVLCGGVDVGISICRKELILERKYFYDDRGKE